MITSAIIIKAIFSAIGLLALSLITGRLLERLGRSKQENGKSIFEPLITGLLMIVSLYAVYITGGRTIFLPIVLLLLLAGSLKNERELVDTERISGRTIFLLMGAALVLYGCFFSQAFIGGHEGTVRYASGDYAFYARLAEFLNVKGSETYQIDFETASPAVQPYHYMDIWSTALVSRFSGLNENFSLVLVVLPVFAVVFTVGAFELYTRIFGIAWIPFLVALVSLLLAGIGFLYPSFLFTADVHDYGMANYAKTLFPGSLILYSLVLFREGRKNAFLLSAIIACLSFITLGPAMAIMVGLIILYWLLREKRTIYKTWPAILAGILSLAYFYWFYHNSGEGRVITKLTMKDWLLSSAKMMLSSGMEYLILLPVLIIVFLFFRKAPVKDRALLILLLIFPLAGLIGWGILWPVDNESQQFFHLVFSICAALLTGIALTWCFRQPNRIVYGLPASLLLVFLLYKNHRYDFHVQELSKDDLSKTEAFIRKNGMGKFANLRDPSEFNSYYELYTRVFQPLPWLGYLIPEYQNYSLNTPELAKKAEGLTIYREQALNELKHSAYYLYSMEGNQDEQTMQNFLKDKGVSYLAISSLSREKPENIVITDSISLSAGWKIYRLKF